MAGALPVVIISSERKMNMKNINKRIVAIAALLCVAMTGIVGCSSGSSNNNSTGSSSKEAAGNSASDSESPTLSEEELAAIMHSPFKFGGADDADAPAFSAPDADINGADPTKPADGAKDTTKVEEVTDADGQPVTQMVIVTDEKSGQPVTDANGATATEPVKVTTIVNVSGEDKTPDVKPGSDYTPKTDSRYTLWYDISKDKDFLFEDDFIEVVFKVKEGIPDGDYKIQIVPDLSDIKGTVIQPAKVLEGTIRVNNGEIQPTDVSGENGFIFYGDNVACKQGDEITYHINVKNNSGIAGFVVWFKFDSNALEVKDCYPCGAFADLARSSEFGGGNKTE